MRIYLAEGITGGLPFLVDRSRPLVTESRPAGKVTRIPGRFSVCDSVNGNNRRYRARVWEKNLKPGSPLQESIKRNAAFGLLEHPDDGKVSLLSPISHQVTKAEMVEAKDASGNVIMEVHGEIEIYDTEEGRKLKALIEGGYNPMVSSRGFGSLTRGADGVDEVEDDFVCESWDVVIKPSFATAELVPNRGTGDQAFAESKTSTSVTETVSGKSTKLQEGGTGFGDNYPSPEVKVLNDPAEIDRVGRELGMCLSRYKQENPGVTLIRADACVAAVKDGKVVECRPTPTPAQKRAIDAWVAANSTGAAQTTPTPPPSSPAVSETRVTEKTMNLSEIQSRIEALRQASAGQDPKRFAESMQEADVLHTAVDRYIAEDSASRNYQGKRLHEAVENITRKFQESVQAPAKLNKKLQENNTKLIKVVHGTAQAAMSYKTKLSESVSKTIKQTELIEELTKRGQGWHKLAEARQAELAALNKRYGIATEALDKMAERYHADITAVAKKLIETEFGEKAKAPEIVKRLSEAKRLREIAAIRETLEGKPAEGQKPEAAPAPKAVTESAPAPKAEATTVTESKVMLSQSKRDPRDLNESVDMVRRLSPVTA